MSLASQVALLATRAANECKAIRAWVTATYQPLDADLTAIAALASQTTFGRALLTTVDAAGLRSTAGLGTAATQATSAFDPAGSSAAAQAASQPLDSDLTAIAALATTSFGRAFLSVVDAADGRTYIGAETAGAAAAAQAASQPLDPDLTAIATLATTTFGRSLLTAADAAAGRAALSAQPLDLDLTAIAAVASQTTYGQAVLALVNAAGARTYFGAEAAGAAAAAQAASQPLDSDLTAIAALTTTSFGRALLSLADSAALTGQVAAASETVVGKIEIATSAETTTGTDDVRAITPLKLKGYAQPLDSDLTAIAALTTTSFGRALLQATDAYDLRSLAGIGASVAANRFVATSFTNAATTTYGVLSNAGERGILTTTLNKLAGMNLLVSIHGSIVLNTGGPFQLYVGIRINSIDYDVAMTYVPTTGRFVMTGTRLITSVLAGSGSWTCEPVVKASASASVNWYSGADMLSYSIQQVHA